MSPGEEVIASEEARRRLPEMLRAFRTLGRRAPHYVIGRHRRPEAVLVPISDYEKLVASAGRPRADVAALLQENRAEILRITRRRGARNIRVFGSASRGEATPQSDIDLLVDLESGWSLLDLGGLFAELEELLGRPVDVVPSDSLKPGIRGRVLMEAVPL